MIRAPEFIDCSLVTRLTGTRSGEAQRVVEKNRQQQNEAGAEEEPRTLRRARGDSGEAHRPN